MWTWVSSYRHAQDARIELRVGGSADAPVVEWLAVPRTAAGACRTGDVAHAL
jgi:hypothetical protein